MKRTLQLISLVVLTAILLTSALAQRQQQNITLTTKRQTTAAQNNNTPDRIAKFGDRGFVIDSNITEDANGKIGIGTATPTSPLTVQGMIETTLGGYKFPDGTLQTTAGLASVFSNTTLTGNGTQASPLSVAVPLNLSGSAQGSVLVVSNTGEGRNGVTVNAGSGTFGGNAIVSTGGGGTTGSGGIGVRGDGGGSFSGGGGAGVAGVGGDTFSGVGGTGVIGQAGEAINGNGGIGVLTFGGRGQGDGHKGGNGIEAFAGPGIISATNGLAGKFHGDVEVTGNLSKGGGSFKIDHPLDPENKYLYHSFVESPDMKNIYDGTITTDGNGEATVTLPDWFEALNQDFRYQLTVIGTFAQVIVAQEIKGNRFVVKTNAPNVKVSWQVTGTRHDAFANQNRIPVEQNKPEAERGFFLYPSAFGQPEEKNVLTVQHSEVLRQLKETQEKSKKQKLQKE
jgi:hypothetical protein